MLAEVGGIDGFLRLCEHIGTDTLGLNFDTGHARACKENLYLIPAKLGGRILGTHLCDNFGHENLSLRPGAGSIDWPRLQAGRGLRRVPLPTYPFERSPYWIGPSQAASSTNWNPAARTSPFTLALSIRCFWASNSCPAAVWWSSTM